MLVMRGDNYIMNTKIEVLDEIGDNNLGGFMDDKYMHTVELNIPLESIGYSEARGLLNYCSCEALEELYMQVVATGWPINMACRDEKASRLLDLEGK